MSACERCGYDLFGSAHKLCAVCTAVKRQEAREARTQGAASSPERRRRKQRAV